MLRSLQTAGAHGNAGVPEVGSSCMLRKGLPRRMMLRDMSRASCNSATRAKLAELLCCMHASSCSEQQGLVSAGTFVTGNHKCGLCRASLGTPALHRLKMKRMHTSSRK